MKSRSSLSRTEKICLKWRNFRFCSKQANLKLTTANHNNAIFPLVTSKGSASSRYVGEKTDVFSANFGHVCRYVKLLAFFLGLWHAITCIMSLQKWLHNAIIALQVSWWKGERPSVRSNQRTRAENKEKRERKVALWLPRRGPRGLPCQLHNGQWKLSCTVWQHFTVNLTTKLPRNKA